MQYGMGYPDLHSKMTLIGIDESRCTNPLFHLYHKHDKSIL